jgi:hypothetical protein
MEFSREVKAEWLKGSGLNRRDHPNIKIFYSEIGSKNTVNALDVTFYSKLHWLVQASNIILKADRALNAIRRIKNFLPKKE